MKPEEGGRAGGSSETMRVAGSAGGLPSTSASVLCSGADGIIAARGNADGSVSLFEATRDAGSPRVGSETRTLLSDPTCCSDPVTALAWSPTCRQLAVATPSEIVLFYVAEREQCRRD